MCFSIQPPATILSSPDELLTAIALLSIFFRATPFGFRGRHGKADVGTAQDAATEMD